ncbi:uncharacterized protein LOC110987042 [Acanthaster planci]|uniref:Uncharacterized protein LOC110987042 n=1 Tax=Acanthaster planci TaxID=133434 RepID=A0A8B7ZHT1_ACAPL|nr:uncharacterized protein LOC110987042 [Acanthaster planci]
MNSLHSLGRDGSRTPDFEDPYDTRYETKWEATPIKPFKTQTEYLYAMVEDLAEWLNNLYHLDITPDNFFEKLETGTVLCQHANNVRRVAQEYRQIHGRSEKDIVINDNDIKFRVDAKEGSFNARDNISNFITWCRHCLNIKDVLLFESDDLVLRKNVRSFILCLLEVARRGSKVGMPVPLLVQFEEDIEREIKAGLMERTSEADSEPSIEPASPTSSAATTDVDHELGSGSDADHEMDSQRSESPDLSSLNGNHSNSPSSVPSRMRKGSKKSRLPKPLPHQARCRGSDGYGSAEIDVTAEQGPPPQVMLEPEVLKSLHERVRELVNECTCPNQFPMVREAEGKYRIGDQSTLIFVRILRNHVMVRIGGGWDTLEHYLDKHDPCKCKLHRSGGRSRTSSFGSNYRKSPKRRVSVEGPKLHSRNQSVESLDDCDNRSVRSPSPRIRREDSNETLASLDSNHSADLLNNSSTPARGRPGSLGRNSPARSSLQAEKRPSQLPRRLSQAGTSTEEFLRKRREESNADGQSQNHQGSLARSAPTSPTRHVRPLSCTPVELNESNVQSDVYRRLALAGGRESGSGTHTRRTRSSSVNLTSGTRSRETSLDRSIPISPSMRRKHRSGSLNVNTSRADAKKLTERRDNSIIMISRDTGGRHRLNSTSSCDSNDLRSHDGSSLRSPTDSEKSATECVTQRLRERERTRSLSVDRSVARTKIPSFERGSRLRASTGVGEGRAPLSHIPTPERKSRLRASIGVSEAGSTQTQSPSFERGSKLRATTGSMGSSARARSATAVHSQSSTPQGNQEDTVQNMPRKQPRESRLQRSGSLRNPRTDRHLFGNLSQDQEGGFARNSARRRTITGRDTKAPRQPVPAKLNAENLARYLQSYQNRVAPRETRSETRSNASSRASSRASSPGTSRLRPRIPIPSHLKAEPKTPMRRDSLENATPSRIPMPVQHKRLLSEGNASSRSHSLPDLIANMMDWCQRTINIDNYDTRSFTSADSMSPTPSLRTDQDSGYEDNPQKGSPLGPDEPYQLRRAGRSGSLAEGGEEAPALSRGARGSSGKRH